MIEDNCSVAVYEAGGHIFILPLFFILAAVTGIA